MAHKAGSSSGMERFIGKKRGLVEKSFDGGSKGSSFVKLKRAGKERCLKYVGESMGENQF